MCAGVAPSGGMTALDGSYAEHLKGQGGILMDGCSVMRVETHPKIAVDLDAGGCSSTQLRKESHRQCPMGKIGTPFTCSENFPGIRDLVLPSTRLLIPLARTWVFMKGASRKHGPLRGGGP